MRKSEHYIGQFGIGNILQPDTHPERECLASLSFGLNEESRGNSCSISKQAGAKLKLRLRREKLAVDLALLC